MLRRAVAAAGALALTLLAAPPALAAGLPEPVKEAGSRIWDRIAEFVSSGVEAVIAIVVLLFLFQFLPRLLGGFFRRW